MPIEVASAAVKITPDFTGFSGALGAGIRGQTRQAGASAQALGGVLTAAVTLPVAALGKASVSAFADFNQAMTERGR
jgi:hypothetical protein